MDRPIRVLELRSVFGTGGGPDKTILASARRDESEVALTVCYLRHRDDAVFPIGEMAKDLGDEYIEIKERHSLDPAVWPALRQIARERQINIVHGHEYKTDLLAYALAKAEKIIPLATAHGWTGHSKRERFLYYPADKRLLAFFPKVIAVSGEIRQTLIRTGSRPERVEVVLNGIDPARFRYDPQLRAEARQRFVIGPGDLAIGAVGRLEPQKRFDLLIEAFGSIRQNYPTAKLLIAGDGSLKGPLDEQIRRAGLDNDVRLVGHVDVIPFHHALDLFVQSSDYEGTPNVVLEAMALESPVVATDVGGTSELALHGVHALIVQPRRTDELRDAMAQALADPAARLGRVRAARTRVEQELSFDRRMARVNAIYRELMDGVSAGRTRPLPAP